VTTIPSDAATTLERAPVHLPGRAIDEPSPQVPFSIARPIGVLMIFLAVMVFGGFSIRLLPLDLMPDISYPKLTVRTQYSGAAPAEVETNVSRPLEEVLGVVTGLRRIESASRSGYSDVILEFDWSTDMDKANQDVLELLDAVAPRLPDDAETPLILRYDPTLDPVLTLSVAGEGALFSGPGGLKLLRRIADRDVRRMLEPVPGVAALKVKGGLEEQIDVDLDSATLRRLGIDVAAVVERLAAENVNLAGGRLEDGRTRYLVRTVNEFTSVEDVGEVVIAQRNGAALRLRDLGAVRSGHKEREVITRVDGLEAVEVEIYKEAEANIVAMADAVRKIVLDEVAPELSTQYGVRITIVSDRSLFIESSIGEVRAAAVSGGILAVLVLLVFLRELRSTIVIAISIPVSILVTFAPLQIAGVSLNIMSLGGLALGVGMLVDNSIVVLESIHRCRSQGDDLLTATVRGTSEVGRSVMASTLTTIAVFGPMVFVEGVAGQMFGDLGLAVVFSLTASLVVALFLIPALTARAIAPDLAPDWAPSDDRTLVSATRNIWSDFTSIGDLRASWRFMTTARMNWMIAPYVLVRFVVHVVFEGLGKVLLSSVVMLVYAGLAIYRILLRARGFGVGGILALLGAPFTVLEIVYPRIIRFSLRRRWVIHAIALACLGLVIWGAGRLDTELIPEIHQGEFTAELSFPPGTPLQTTSDRVAELEARIVEATPYVESMITTVGTPPDTTDSAERGEHVATLQIRLATPKESVPWARTATLVEHERAAMNSVRAMAREVPDLRIDLRRPVLFSFEPPIEVEVRSYDLDVLGMQTERVADLLAELPGLRDVHGSVQAGMPELHVRYDRDGLARYGLDIRKVAELVRDAVEGAEATRLRREDRKIPILVRQGEADRASLDELRDLVVNPGGERPVTLGAVADLEVGRGPSEILRVGQRRVGLVTAKVDGVGLGAMVQQIERAMTEAGLPPDVTWAVTGQSREWETSYGSLVLALGLSVFVVYVIMAVQFESVIYPLIILLTIPLAFAGVIAELLWFRQPLSVVVFLGAIMLAGIVVNNAIVLVDYVGHLKDRGLPTALALETAGQVRLRPILMTTSTTVLGLVPMALGLGEGAEIQAPMAVTVIAGLVCSTVLTLVVIPTLYADVDRWTIRFARRSRAAQLEEELRQVTPDQLRSEIDLVPEAPRSNPGTGD